MLLALLVFGTLVQVIPVALIANTLATHTVSAEAAGDSSEARSFRVGLGVNIRGHCELLLLLILVGDHGCFESRCLGS